MRTSLKVRIINSHSFNKPLNAIQILKSNVIILGRHSNQSILHLCRLIQIFLSHLKYLLIQQKNQLIINQININMLRYLSKLSCYKFVNFQDPSKICSAYDIHANKFVNKDLQHFKQQLTKIDKHQKDGDYTLPGVNIITTEQECKKCVDILMKNPQAISVWDTETVDINPREQSPVGRGKIICASFFSGPQFNFGRGPRVFIDNFGKNAGLINFFKSYLQNESYLKVWHNYAFDRHLFFNHRINVRGFGGDTMQMAFLHNCTRGFGLYSLASLTKEYKPIIDKIPSQFPKKISKVSPSIKDVQKSQQQRRNLQEYFENYYKPQKLIKSNIEQQFLGKSGKDTLQFHTKAEYIPKWIEYCTKDTQTTFYLWEALKSQLIKDQINGQFGMNNMLQLYDKYWKPLGQILTDIQRAGIKVDFQKIKNLEQQTRQSNIQPHKLQNAFNYFFHPLRNFADQKNRIHFPLYINKQSGRLSSSIISLQTLFLATKKDDFKQSFIAEQNNSLLVGHYVHLQLQMLADFSQCKLMIQGLQKDDWHQRVAVKIFKDIQQEVKAGKILQEWDESKGVPPVPLLKHKYANRIKMVQELNNAIPYGLTEYGIAKMMNCPMQLATKIKQLWFKVHPQILKWYSNVQALEKSKSLLGRNRQLNDPELKTRLKKLKYHPIQNAAADILIAAMVKVAKEARLKELGWKQVMQFGDEIILQGPQASAKEAAQIIRQCLKHPLDKHLRTDLKVNVKIGKSWDECK